MSGLVKQKTIDVADSNIANLGSQMERDTKKASAETEKAWKGCGQKAGVEIWRIEKFKVVNWPKESYGSFYSGDSYIILHTKEKDKNAPPTRVMRNGKWENVAAALEWDIYFWLGKDSSQDEMGTAAYKTVELDTYLDDAPVQHREVQLHESDDFLKVFGGNICTMEGGVDSGFKHVKPEEYRTRLLHVKGTLKTCRVTEVMNKDAYGPNGFSYKSLNGGDVFILDCGTLVIQWQGNESNPAERRKGGEMAQQILGDRNGRAKTETVEQGKETDFFWEKLGGGKGEKIKTAAEGGADNIAAQAGGSTATANSGKAATKPPKKLFRLSDASGTLKMTEEASGPAVNISKLDPNDVFILDLVDEVIVWIGSKTTAQEKAKGMQYAFDYCKQNNRPDYLSISKFQEGQENQKFRDAFK